MIPRKIYLCMKCRKDFEMAYKVTEVPPLPGVPVRPSDKPCENCRRKRLGMWYKVEDK